MSHRLPVVPARAAIARPPAVVERPRVAVSRALLCVAGSAAHAEAALRFACALIAALARDERATTVLVLRGDAFASAGAARELRAAGAHALVELPGGEPPAAAQAALDALPPHAIAIGMGAELAAQLAALLTIRVGRAVLGDAMYPVDLELCAGSEAVASEIGAWLARR